MPEKSKDFGLVQTAAPGLPPMYSPADVGPCRAFFVIPDGSAAWIAALIPDSTGPGSRGLKADRCWADHRALHC